jgi:predicted dienelactone hydrolase
MHTISGRGVGFLLLPFALLVTSRSSAADPRKPGPYAVGVKTEVFVDEGRTCAITGKPRTLVTEIWYPAAPGAEKYPLNKFSDFWISPEGKSVGAFVISRFGGKFDELEKNFKNVARRNAEIHDGVFPLLVFSHGNGGLRHQNTFQAEYLASHGYVVVAPDHTGNAAVSILPDRLVVHNSLSRKPERRDDRPNDVSFLITKLTAAGDKKHWLQGHLDAAKVGAFGHSFGGFTVCRLTELDPRVKAIVPMTLAVTAIEDGKYGESNVAKIVPCQVPMMVLLGDADLTVKEKGNQASTTYFERATGPKYLLNFKNAGHYTFTEVLQINPNFGDGIGTQKSKDGTVKFTFSDAGQAQTITNEYSVAFFDAFLRNDAEARKFLDENHYADVMAYEKK